jgi:hypothetical protein
LIEIDWNVESYFGIENVILGSCLFV